LCKAYVELDNTNAAAYLIENKVLFTVVEVLVLLIIVEIMRSIAAESFAPEKRERERIPSFGILSKSKSKDHEAPISALSIAQIK